MKPRLKFSYSYPLEKKFALRPDGTLVEYDCRAECRGSYDPYPIAGRIAYIGTGKVAGEEKHLWVKKVRDEENA